MEDDCKDAGGRATQGAVAELESRRRPTRMSEVRTTHDSMDGGGRTALGTAVEEQLPGSATELSKQFAG